MADGYIEIPINSSAADNLTPPEFSDEALALAFAERHANDLRYIAAWGKWMIWTGTVWKPDDTLAAFSLVRAVCREQSAISGKDAVSERLASAATVAAVERLARSDRRLAATVDQWDADPWALNTPGGIINLRNGERLPNDPLAYCTKITAVAPDGDCPIWRAFLDRVTGGDKALQLFLQRIAGYALTGDVSEHALFFAYGTGGNGKGVFINTISAVMGDYAVTAVMDTFTASQNDRHKSELAMLRGARLVSAQETEQGRRWAESRIKSLTGGDPITANFMRQDHFTFMPQFKLLIAGNHKPGLRSVDDAMKRRMNLLPFTQTIGPGERDPQLPDKLKAEWPGILLWAVDGCAEWREKRLSPPESVKQATAEYLEAEDTVALWLAECCKTDFSLKTSVSELFVSWSAWATKAGEHAGSQKSFSQTMANRGFAPSRLSGGRAAFIGLGLNAQADDWRVSENG
jgi:putative DNA primase/helicase